MFFWGSKHLGFKCVLGPLSLGPAHICLCELPLQENLIGALLAIFGHLVVSIALNLQVSLPPALCGAEVQAVSQGVPCRPSGLCSVRGCPLPGLGLGQWLVGLSRIS